VGVPVLAAGLLVHNGLASDGARAAFRTAGTGVALGGVLVLLTAIGLAWPEPGAVLLVCALNFLVLTWVAVRYRLTPVHAAALFCLALGYLTAVHLVVDPPGSDLVASFLTVRTGVAVVVLAALLAAAAEGIARLGRPPDAVCYAAASGVLA